VLRSVARRRLVETANLSACTTVNWNVCKSAIALYCLYLSVIKRECVTEVLINPIIPTRTRHFVTRTALHVTACMYFLDIFFSLLVFLTAHRKLLSKYPSHYSFSFHLSTTWSRPSDLSVKKIMYCFLIYTMRATCPSSYSLTS
jgi:hypothetical protein